MERQLTSLTRQKGKELIKKHCTANISECTCMLTHTQEHTHTHNQVQAPVHMHRERQTGKQEHIIFAGVDVIKCANGPRPTNRSMHPSSICKLRRV